MNTYFTYIDLLACFLRIHQIVKHYDSYQVFLQNSNKVRQISSNRIMFKINSYRCKSIKQWRSCLAILSKNCGAMNNSLAQQFNTQQRIRWSRDLKYCFPNTDCVANRSLQNTIKQLNLSIFFQYHPVFYDFLLIYNLSVRPWRKASSLFW